MGTIEKCKSRFLLVMITGTGINRTFNVLIDALMWTGWAERTLFLLGRIALCDQTLNALKANYQSSLQESENLYVFLSQSAFMGELNFAKEKMRFLLPIKREFEG